MSAILYNPVVKAIEIGLGDGDAIFVNWDIVKIIEVETCPAREETFGIMGTAAKAEHVIISIEFNNGDESAEYDSSNDIIDTKHLLREEIKRLNNG